MLQGTSNSGGLNCGERPASYDAQLEAARASVEAGTAEHLRAAIHSCRNCSLWAPATQAVPGEGPANADIMIIGEQPGDQEDLEGKPFIGPAGQLLDQVLESLGVQRKSLYVTNAVKHFKFKATPKRRLHERPKAGEIEACRHWLIQEIGNVSPKLIICLGATAARSLLGRAVSVSSLRGKTLSWQHHTVVVTTHPAAVLRAPDREAALATLTEDLRQAFSWYSGGSLFNLEPG
jgi:DNA polymerase